MRQVVTYRTKSENVKFFSNNLIPSLENINYDTNVTFSSCCDVQRNNGNPLWAEGVNVIYILRAQRVGKFTLPSKLLVCVMLLTHFLLHHLISASHLMLRPPHLPSKNCESGKGTISFSYSRAEGSCCVCPRFFSFSSVKRRLNFCVDCVQVKNNIR